MDRVGVTVYGLPVGRKRRLRTATASASEFDLPSDLCVRRSSTFA